MTPMNEGELLQALIGVLARVDIQRLIHDEIARSPITMRKELLAEKHRLEAVLDRFCELQQAKVGE
jgi:hypothetical protein